MHKVGADFGSIMTNAIISILSAAGTKIIEDVITESPKETPLTGADIPFRRAAVLFQIKRYNDAIECYVQTLEKKPDFAEAWYNLGIIHNLLEQKQEAVNCFLQAIEVKPDWSEAWFCLGVILTELGQFEDGGKALAKTLELKPDFDDAWQYTGILIQSLGGLEEADNCFDKALEIKPDKVESWFTKGIVLTQLKRYQEAINCFSTTLQYRPDLDLAWALKGAAFSEIGQTEQENNCFREALKIEHVSCVGDMDLANTFLLMGQYSLAREAAEKAYLHVDTLANKAVCLALIVLGHYFLGEKDKTLAALGDAMEIIEGFGGRVTVSCDFSPLALEVSKSNRENKADVLRLFTRFQKAKYG